MWLNRNVIIINVILQLLYIYIYRFHYYLFVCFWWECRTNCTGFHNYQFIRSIFFFGLETYSRSLIVSHGMIFGIYIIKL